MVIININQRVLSSLELHIHKINIIHCAWSAKKYPRCFNRGGQGVD